MKCKQTATHQRSLTHVDKHVLDRLRVTKEIVKVSKAVDVETIPALLYIFYYSGRSVSFVAFLIRDSASPTTWKRAPVMSCSVDMNHSLYSFWTAFSCFRGKGKKKWTKKWVCVTERELSEGLRCKWRQSDGWMEEKSDSGWWRVMGWIKAIRQKKDNGGCVCVSECMGTWNTKGVLYL